jgi:uncharacterized protein (DUF2141 family)
MKKFICFLFIFFVFFGYCFSQTGDVNITVDVTNISVNNGRVYLVFFANAEQFKNEEPYLAFALSDSGTSASQQVTLPPGEYVITAFQDTNNNQKVDYNLIGIPKELLGISNYNGRGFPTRIFDRQKIRLNNTTERITIRLYKL